MGARKRTDFEREPPRSARVDFLNRFWAFGSLTDMGLHVRAGNPLRFNVIPEFAATKAELSSGLSLLVCLLVLLTAACSKDEKAAAGPGAFDIVVGDSQWLGL